MTAEVVCSDTNQPSLSGRPLTQAQSMAMEGILATCLQDNVFIKSAKLRYFNPHLLRQLPPSTGTFLSGSTEVARAAWGIFR